MAYAAVFSEIKVLPDGNMIGPESALYHHIVPRFATIPEGFKKNWSKQTITPIIGQLVIYSSLGSQFLIGSVSKWEKTTVLSV